MIYIISYFIVMIVLDKTRVSNCFCKSKKITCHLIDKQVIFYKMWSQLGLNQ